MAETPKLTPTFNDKANGGAGSPQVRMMGPFPQLPPTPVPMQSHPRAFITPAHEPLSTGERLPAPEPLAQSPQPQPQIKQVSMPLGDAPAVQARPLKIALIGTAPTSRGLAPYNDPTWTIWACSPGNMGQIPRADAWFEVHGNLLWPECRSYGEPYIEWMKKLPIPVYMQNNDWVPNAIVFPKDDLVKKFGRDFFTSSFTWMMAFAIDQGCSELALYGIDMASRNEYILQRPGFYFFKYIAEQRGIKVSAPNESDIMQPPGLYGYSDVTPMGRKILARETEITQRLTHMRAERDRLVSNITYLEGAAEDLDYFKSIWMGQG